ncbi:MAG TPA: threonine--tRNA ligase [Exilispira sp.]|nr:threonine--tRNA ligase [Spirochaetota bacterium]HNV43668.1 threonine--tRNA ligase [Exilispira sp.]HOV46679.1 threonine--tRNA ligase [Exilispira sp.]
MENKIIDEALEKRRHSLSHILAMAVQKLYPQAKLGIGPAIDNGFYYDFDLDVTFSESDLVNIEQLMREIIKENLSFTRETLPIDEAKEIFKRKGELFKVELIEDLKQRGEKEVSIYKTSDWFDLCKGPHVNSTSDISLEGLKLDRVSGAYWKGDEKNKMLQRIYGLYFNSKKELEDYVNWREEAKKRDHRKIGKEMDLFSLHDEAGAGLVYWHPNGARMRAAIESFWKSEHFKNGYEIVYTPHIGKSWLWETSGHLDFYRDNMYSSMKIDENDYYIKPMNCPFHMMIYKTNEHSYRDLPYRWAELGTVYRYEMSGVLHGLLRVRGFTQDDAHIICTPEQIESEILEVLRFSLSILRAFGFNNIKAYLSTKPEKSVGEEFRWQQATESLKKAIDIEKLDYQVDEGGGAFYGPKIDLKVMDALNREWQLSTIQFDFNEPERFEMVYKDSDGKEKRPYMVHRALLGSLERFFGVLIEHYAGKFPLWFAPVQVMIIPIADRHLDYARTIYSQLRHSEIYCKIDEQSDTVSKKIFRAHAQHIPYSIVIGDKELESKTVTVKNRDTQKQTTYNLSDFIIKLISERDSRSNALGL